MSTISDYFNQAELALAAYSQLWPDMGRTQYLAALRNSGRNMSVDQATRFADIYSVAAQYNTSSGLSATVFVENTTGKTFLAIRGTDDGYDLLTDAVDIAFFGSTQFQLQYASLKTMVSEWIANGTLSSSFTVAGHSLGGFLATGIAADFAPKVTHAYLYNSPGIGGILGTVFSPLSSLLSAMGLSSSIDPSKISNIKASAGLSLIAGLGIQVSPTIPIVIEDQLIDVPNPPAASNHSQQVLTGALALYAAFAKLDPNLSVSDFNALLKSATEKNHLTLETTLTVLRKLILGSTVADTAIDDRESFYNDLKSLQINNGFTSLINQAQLTVLAPRQSASIVDLANESDTQGLATRYALSALNPFTLVGVDYSSFNQNGELDLNNPETGAGNMTAQYLTDRANFLKRKLWFSTNDLNPVDPSVTPDPNKDLFQNEESYYKDVATGYQILQGQLFLNTHVHAFGSDTKDDILTGQGLEDHLYAGQTSLPQNYQDQLAPVLAANWQ